MVSRSGDLINGPSALGFLVGDHHQSYGLGWDSGAPSAQRWVDVWTSNGFDWMENPRSQKRDLGTRED